jgi:hypothetical protein
MADESAPFSCFASLCQVIHQSDQRFLVISYTNDEEDVLRESLPPIDGMELRDEGEGCVYFEVGEIGATTAWWRGIWTLEDVQKAGVRLELLNQLNLITFYRNYFHPEHLGKT